MAESIKAFIFDSLREMNCDIEEIDDDSQLGPRGADLGSLALAELVVRVEDRFGVSFGEDEAEELAAMTVSEFCACVGERMAPAAAAT